MPEHIDVISNEPLTGRQTLLGRLHVDGDDLRLEADNEDHLWQTLVAVVPDVDPHQDPHGFVEALPERLDSIYVIASCLHSDDACAFDVIGGPAMREQTHRRAVTAW